VSSSNSSRRILINGLDDRSSLGLSAATSSVCTLRSSSAVAFLLSCTNKWRFRPSQSISLPRSIAGLCGIDISSQINNVFLSSLIYSIYQPTPATPHRCLLVLQYYITRQTCLSRLLFFYSFYHRKVSLFCCQRKVTLHYR
jgi:hypothetical protein